MVTFASLRLSVRRLCYSGYHFGNFLGKFRLIMAQFRLLGAKFGLIRVTLNSGVYLGYPGLRLRLGIF